MLDDDKAATDVQGEAGDQAAEKAAEKPARARAPRKKAAAEPAAETPQVTVTTRTRSTRKKAAPAAEATVEPVAEAAGEAPAPKKKPTEKTSTKKAATAKKATAAKGDAPEAEAPETAEKKPAKSSKKPAKKPAKKSSAATEPEAAQGGSSGDAETAPTTVLFQAPEAPSSTRSRRTKATPAEDAEKPSEPADEPADEEARAQAEEQGQEDGESGESGGRRRRRRGGRRRRKGGGEAADAGSESSEGDAEPAEATEGDSDADPDAGGGSSSSRRRRRRRRAGEDDANASQDDPANTVTRVRKVRNIEDEITAVTGSTRLEAKKQRRREGREAGRRRAPIVSEAEFLARRESVERVMVIRERDDLIQIAVLEDKVLVEHYVARESQTSLIGNVYLGRVQNVLPSMEAAFIDIGKGRNAVLYAGEVNWQALGHKEGTPRKIESVLSSGQTVLVQVTKDPVGHKGARLTSQISLAGRFLVYVPDGTTNGISRKLPDTERNRLKTLLKEIVPDSAGVIVRTAAEGASEEELTRDVERLKARWADIDKATKGSAPQLLYGEPDLTLKVVRDLFTEDFASLVIEGDGVWSTVHDYVEQVAPDLLERVKKFDRSESSKPDVFATYRIDEQIHKALDRKVWLPSGGSLVIDRTEAMTVVDVNTGKFTGSGGNLEETVTKNNLEAAEEIVRQLRLRDIGGIIVIDFIDMVLESNRDLVLRRLVECLGRDRTRHQVAEVTSLGLVQMTRKRIGTGLLEAFSETCDHCHGRGLMVADAPIEPKRGSNGGEDEGRRSRRSRGGKQDNGKQDSQSGGGQSGNGRAKPAPSPKDLAGTRPHEDPPAESADVESADVESAGPDESAEVESAGSDAPAEVESAASDTPAEVESAAPDLTPEPPAEPEPPKVVVRTRRRATRPAGPPASGETDTPGTPETAGEESGDPAASTLHVPVKKRGARKR